MWKDLWISSNLPQILGTKEDWGRNREVFLLRRLHGSLTNLHFSWWLELVICPYVPARNPLTKMWFGSQFISRKGQGCPPSPLRWGSWLPEALPCGPSWYLPSPWFYWAVCPAIVPTVCFSFSLPAPETCKRKNLMYRKYFTFTLEFIVNFLSKFVFLIAFLFTLFIPRPRGNQC